MASKNQHPKHIAIICDGNRRWARGRGLPATMGHEYAVKTTMENLIDKAIELDIKYLTFWIFSTENWDRDKEEIEALMNLFRFMFDHQMKKLGKKDVRVKIIGNRSGLSTDIQERIIKGEEATKDNKRITVTFAMNYGGHDELVRAMAGIAQDVKNGVIEADKINTQLIESYLDTVDMPNPDMIVRTSGEQRLSGFMPWQSEYAEYFFPKFSFPDFTPDRLEELLEEFYQRNRRFGGN